MLWRRSRDSLLRAPIIRSQRHKGTEDLDLPSPCLFASVSAQFHAPAARGMPLRVSAPPRETINRMIAA